MTQSKKVLLPQPIAEDAHQLLVDSGFEVIVADNPKVETVRPLLADAGAIVLRTGISLTEELMGEAPQLLTVSRTGGGVDNVDLEGATKHGVLVTSSLGVNTSTVIEHSLALMLSLYKQLPVLDREVRANNFRIRYKNLPRDVRGKTLGVVGFGRIGSGLAKICHQSLGMKVMAFDEYLPEAVKEANRDWVDFVELDELMQGSDVVSLHIPATAETRGMINRKYFSMMKNRAVLINASRGEVVNETDLAEALNADELGGAGIDVFESEPPAENSPILTAKNTILTPHSAALTNECVVRMAVSAVERVIDVYEGRKPESIANPEVLKQERWKGL